MKQMGAKQLEELIPGLPDDVVQTHIFTRLPWQQLLLSAPSVSSGWRQFIRSEELHKVKMQTKVTQKLVVIVHKAHVLQGESQATEGLLQLRSSNISPGICASGEDLERTMAPEEHLAISLYDPSTNNWQRLPPIPGINRNVPGDSRCVVVNRKVYALGGSLHGFTERTARDDVFMLNLFEVHKGWNRCAPMTYRRSGFGCEVIDMNIYVIGGFCGDTKICEAEVFDTERNIWHCIHSLPETCRDYLTATLNGQLCLIGCSNDQSQVPEDMRYAYVYDPSNNEWRRQEISAHKEGQSLFVLDENLIGLAGTSVFGINFKTNERTDIKPNSWEDVEERNPIKCSPCGAVAVDGEVFVFLRWITMWPYDICLVRSNCCFWESNEATTWTKVNFPYSFGQHNFARSIAEI